MPLAVTVMKLLADLNDLARAVRPLRNHVLDALLSEARKEIRKSATKKDEQPASVSDQKKLPPS